MWLIVLFFCNTCSVEKNLDTYSFGGIFKNTEYLLQHDINMHHHLEDHGLFRASIEKLQRSSPNNFLFLKAFTLRQQYKNW